MFVAIALGACSASEDTIPKVPGVTAVKLVEHRYKSGTHSLRIGFYLLNSRAEFDAARQVTRFAGRLMPLPDGVDFEKVRLGVLAPAFRTTR